MRPYKTTIAANSGSEQQIPVAKITALWAFSESALGGILHALTIPLRGIFINSAAVLLITLISFFSKSSRAILKSTLIVVLIKAMVSPHSPLTAYLAVSIQGILGYLFFLSKKFFRVSALFLGMITLLLSGIQKILVLTILFGNNLWKSIDIFIKQVSNEILGPGILPDMHYGFLLIGIYVSIHLVAGIIAGLYAGSLPERLGKFSDDFISLNRDENLEVLPEVKRKVRSRSWLTRPTGIFIIAVLIIVLIYSYASPGYTGIASLEILIMLFRSVIITILWYSLLSPVIKKIFIKFITGKKAFYSEEIDEILNLFPEFKKIAGYTWRESQDRRGIRRIRYFLTSTFYYLLLSRQV